MILQRVLPSSTENLAGLQISMPTGRFYRSFGNMHVTSFLLTGGLSYEHSYHPLANMGLGPLLTRSSLTCLEVSSMVFPGFYCLLVCSFFSILGNLLQGILFKCCN